MTGYADTRMFAEAAEAADVVARQTAANQSVLDTIARQLQVSPPRTVLTCARGSSDHAATYLKHLVETRVGIVVASVSPSISSVYHAAPDMRDMLAICLSQSGQSPDLVATMQAAAVGGAHTLAMVNVTSSPLGKMADTLLPLHAGAEISVAATKSFIALLSASIGLVAAWTRDPRLAAALDTLPAGLRAAWTCNWSALVEHLLGARGLYVVGRGPSLGIAQEAALKLKETCGLHAEAFSAAELRHGPMALVASDFPVLLIGQGDQAADANDALAADLVERGVPVLMSGRAVTGAVQLPLPDGDPIVTPILAIQAFYRAANELSLRRGLDPDRPPMLKKVTETL